jgi:hypothetical protein
MADSDKPEEFTYVLVARDYADIVHLGRPGVIEKILSSSRADKIAYVSALITSGLPKYILSGPRVAFVAMAIEALTDLGKEVSDWIKNSKIPEDFSGRPSGYQTWVELLQEIDSNPVDADRLKALKAMFLAANDVSKMDGDSVLAYQLFQLAKGLSSGELFLLKCIYATHRTNGWLHNATSTHAYNWRSFMANKCGHGLSALVEQNERKLAASGLISPILLQGNLETFTERNARLTDLGIRFCENIEAYDQQITQPTK